MLWLRRGALLLAGVLFPVAIVVADEGEAIPEPTQFITYVLTPGKLTGKEFWQEKTLWREFRFEEFLPYKKPVNPKDTVTLRFSLRGGYSPYAIFGHGEFEPKQPKHVATGWVPLSGGSFRIFPDQSREHLPKWIPERTRLIRVPLIKQYGKTVVNAYDLALGLDRVNKGEMEPIPFQLTPTTNEDGKAGVRLSPVKPLTAGVYFAYSLPDDSEKYRDQVHGFLFAVETPLLGVAGPNATQAQPTTAWTGIQSVDAKLANKVLDYALLSQAIYDLGTAKYTTPNGWTNLLTSKKEPFTKDVLSGFKVSTFIKGKKLVVVFQGSEELVDWTTDFFTLTGAKTAQYRESLIYVGKIIEQQAAANYDIVMTGHSLGGGLATYAALNYDKPAIVFNAAPIGSELLRDIQNLTERKSRVININMMGDVVSGFSGQSGPIYTLEIPVGVQAQYSAEWKAVEDAKHGWPFIRNLQELGASLGAGYDTGRILKELHSIENVIRALQSLAK